MKNQVFSTVFFPGIISPLSHHENPYGIRLARVVDAAKHSSSTLFPGITIRHTAAPRGRS